MASPRLTDERRVPWKARLAVLTVSAAAMALPWPVRAQDAPQAASAFELAYVPTDAVGVLAFRPGAILERPKLKEWISAVPPLAELSQRAGIGLDQIESVTVVVYPGMPQINGAGPNAAFASMAGLIVRAKEPTDWKAAIGRLAPDQRLVFTESRYAGKTYYRFAQNDAPEIPIVPALYLPDDRTMVLAAEANLFRSITRGHEAATGYIWDAAWQRTPPGADLVAAVDVGWVRSLVNAESSRHGQHSGMAQIVLLSMVAPVWEQATAVTMAVDVGSGINVGITVTCADEAGAAGAAETLKALWVLARNTTQGFDRALASAPPEAREALAPLAAEIRTAVSGASIEADGSMVQLALRTDVPLERWIDEVLCLHAARGGSAPVPAQGTRELPPRLEERPR